MRQPLRRPAPARGLRAPERPRPAHAEAAACIEDCVAGAELFRVCEQVGTDWPSFGIPY
ncbi:MAG: hypothetical protein H6737_07045 [Alphaproteobacteria bacterium]|nr:hypothetical protein [Alphaproteobacteria bacterium]